MAKKITLHRTDDMNGAPDAVPFEFIVQGVPYRLDLGEESVTRFYRAIDPFVTAAVRAKTSPVRDIKGASADPLQSAAIRAWARSAGYDLPARGKIPQHVRDAFDIAHTREAVG